MTTEEQDLPIHKRKLRIVVGINSLVTTKQMAYSNHIQFFFRLGRLYPNIEFCLNNPSRMSIDRMRNMSSQIAMEGFDYLLFIDDDVLIPFDCLTGLLDMDADIASADVIIRGYPFDHMLFRYTDESKTGLKTMSDLPEPRGVIDVDAVGCSLTLIKTSLLKRVPKPHFVTGPTTNTEDIYFCCKARKITPDCTIKADTRIQCAHILWEETIGSGNKAAFKEYFERMNPETLKANGNGANEEDWRGKDYLAMIQGRIGVP